jgi:hypothetical protein
MSQLDTLNVPLTSAAGTHSGVTHIPELTTTKSESTDLHGDGEYHHHAGRDLGRNQALILRA